MVLVNHLQRKERELHRAAPYKKSSQEDLTDGSDMDACDATNGLEF